MFEKIPAKEFKYQFIRCMNKFEYNGIKPLHYYVNIRAGYAVIDYKLQYDRSYENLSKFKEALNNYVRENLKNYVRSNMETTRPDSLWHNNTLRVGFTIPIKPARSGLTNRL